MRTRTSLRRALVALVLPIFLPLSTAGCFGSFHMTRNVYDLNREASDSKWVRWLLFIPMTFVYGGASFLDAVAFNAVEFWSGRNPINLTRTFEGPEGERARVTARGQGVFDVVLTESDGAVHRVKLVREGDLVTAYDASGAILARTPADVGAAPPSGLSGRALQGCTGRGSAGACAEPRGGAATHRPDPGAGVSRGRHRTAPPW